MSTYCMSYSTKSKTTVSCTLFFTFYSMLSQEDSDKLYTSVMAYHQVILEYSIINQQIIHSFEIIYFEF